VPLSRWHCPEFARAVIAHAIVASISDTIIWRWLSADAIRPWQHRSWIFPRDPHFATKAGRVRDLYHRRHRGRTLGPHDYGLSADEKTSIQARIRTHPTHPAGPGASVHIEHEYRRGGALAYLAAWDVHHAKLFGRTKSASGIEPFNRLVDQVMRSEPYASARYIYWIVDNGSSHRGRASIERLESRWPTCSCSGTGVRLRKSRVPKHTALSTTRAERPDDGPTPASRDNPARGIVPRIRCAG
jgi:hypothetical protein